MNRNYDIHQTSHFEYAYSSDWTRRVDAVFNGGQHFAWIDAAWAAMLLRQGIIPKEHHALVARETLRHLADPKPGFAGFAGLEEWVTEKHGADVGGSLTIGRTVPPLNQMAMVRRELLKTLCPILDFMDILLDLAERHVETVMPGYTHIRHAQPMTFGHYLLSVFDPLERSLREIEHGYELMNLNELGCGALAGTSLPIDRDLTSTYLGLAGLIENANDAVSYSDGYVELVAALTNFHAVLSRFTLDLNIWSSEEYSFLYLPWRRLPPKPEKEAAHARAHRHSHFMPNKTNNNPTLERSRVAAAALAGALSEIAVMGMRCPHADMHEMLHMADPTVRAVTTTRIYLLPYLDLLPELTVDAGRMLAAVQSGWSTATELGNVLVMKHGLGYRTAHDILNEFIYRSKEAGTPASAPDIELFRELAGRIANRPIEMSAAELKQCLDPTTFVKATGSKGGVSPSEVTRMLGVRRQGMQVARDRQEARIATLETARRKLEQDLSVYAASNSGGQA